MLDIDKPKGILVFQWAIGELGYISRENKDWLKELKMFR